MTKAEFTKLDRKVESMGRKFDAKPSELNRLNLMVAILKRDTAFKTLQIADLERALNV